MFLTFIEFLAEKLHCLVNSKSAIDDVISGLKCNEAVEKFRNDGVSEQSYNEMIISGQSFCEYVQNFFMQNYTGRAHIACHRSMCIG